MRELSREAADALWQALDRMRHVEDFREGKVSTLPSCWAAIQFCERALGVLAEGQDAEGGLGQSPSGPATRSGATPEQHPSQGSATPVPLVEALEKKAEEARALMDRYHAEGRHGLRDWWHARYSAHLEDARMAREAEASIPLAEAGYVLVPLQPTVEQVDAGTAARGNTGTLEGSVNSRACYRAMVAARPIPTPHPAPVARPAGEQQGAPSPTDTLLDALAAFATCCNGMHGGVPSKFDDMASVLHLIREGHLTITGVSVGDLRRAAQVYHAFSTPSSSLSRVPASPSGSGNLPVDDLRSVLEKHFVPRREMWQHDETVDSFAEPIREIVALASVPTADTSGGANYPPGVTSAEHIAHDMRMGRLPQKSSIATFLAEREGAPTADTSDRDKAGAVIGRALGLFASTIKSGEAWSPSCEIVQIAARSALRQLMGQPPQVVGFDPASLTADTSGRGSGTGDRGTASRDAVLDYLFGESGRGWITVRDLAYTAFMRAKDKNAEDGGPTDWFTDTKPLIDRGIAKMRAEVSTRLASPAPAVTEQGEEP